VVVVAAAAAEGLLSASSLILPWTDSLSGQHERRPDLAVPCRLVGERHPHGSQLWIGAAVNGDGDDKGPG